MRALLLQTRLRETQLSLPRAQVTEGLHTYFEIQFSLMMAQLVAWGLAMSGGVNLPVSEGILKAFTM